MSAEELGMDELLEATMDGSPYEEQELPDDLIAELYQLVKKFSLEDMANRRTELMRAREARFFWRGYQYPMFNSDQGSWMVPQSGGLPYSVNGGGDGDDRFYYTTNFYTPLGKALISSLAGTTPPVHFLPCDPFDIDDIAASKEAEKYKGVFYHAVDIGQVLRDLSRYAYTDGRTVAWVHPVTDKKYGYDKDGNPKTQEIVELYGVLEAKVPITARCQSEFHYTQIATELALAQVKDQWPDKASKIKAGAETPASDQFDRVCRLATLQGSDSAFGGDMYAHLVTVSHTWMRPSVFTLVKDQVKREALQNRFPTGLRVTYAGNEFMEAVEEDMDRCIEVFLPQPGDGQAAPSLGEFVVPVQKRVNNLINISQEAWEKGTPLTFADSAVLDSDGMKDQMASPESIIPVKRKAGEPLENSFFKTPPPMQSPDMLAAIKDGMGPQAQLLSGAQPALFGAPMQNSKTAAVYQQARDQALGSLSITYGPLKTFLANITQKAVSYAEDRDADIVGTVPDSKGTYQNTKVSVDKLRAGRYLCKPEVDEGFPESTSAQRQSFMQMIQFLGPNPQFQQILFHPDNQYLFKTIGMKDFEVPGADQRNVQLKEIEELLTGEPVMPTADEIAKVAEHQTLLQAAGHPSPVPQASDLMQSSVPIDPEFDDHAVHLAEVTRWISSDEGQQAKQFNPRGFANVRQHGIEHKRALQNGPQAANPMQNNIPSPAVAKQAALANAAVQEHAQVSGAPAPAQEQPPTL